METKKKFRMPAKQTARHLALSHAAKFVRNASIADLFDSIAEQESEDSKEVSEMIASVRKALVAELKKLEHK